MLRYGPTTSMVTTEDGPSQADTTLALSIEPAEEVEQDAPTEESVDVSQTAQREKLYDQIYTLKDRVLQQQNQMIEMSLAMEEKDRILAELKEIEKKYEKQEGEIAYLREKLPDSIVEKMTTELNNESNGQAAGTTQITSRAGTSGEAGGDVAGGQKKLAKIYGAMRPEDAAPILEKLDDDEIIGILLNMKQRQAAKVLTKLDQSVAARISKRISAG